MMVIKRLRMSTIMKRKLWHKFMSLMNYLKVHFLYFKIMDRYQQEVPSLMDKLKCATYKHGYFSGVRNNHFKVMTCKYEFLFHKNPKDTY